MRKRIAIFFGGPSSEYEVSLESAKSILENIDKKKYEPYLFKIRKDLKSAFYKAGNQIIPPKGVIFKEFTKTLKENKNKFGVALVAALHGEFGEDGTIQSQLENLNIKYTGSNSKSSALCIDKYLSMKKVAGINDLYLPKTLRLDIDKIKNNKLLPFPLILKPNFLGSSVLVFVIDSKKDFNKAISELKKGKVKDLLIQEYINGIEISCGCLQDKKHRFTNLPPIEIRPKSTFFDYSSKYEIGGSEEITPPVSVSKKTSDLISKLAVEIHKKLNCSTYSRSDFIYKDGKIYYLETNTLPGMTKTSLLPQEVQAAGITVTNLLDFIIRESL